jgi:hypothetical protein
MRCRSLSAGLVVVAALGCSGKKFQAKGEEAGAGGTAGMGGTTPTGGASGDAGMPTGGNAGSAGSGPTGGSGGTPCTCAPTTYCRGGECLACAELSMLDFAEPRLLLDHPSASIRFPRTSDAPDSLFYRAGDEGSGQLWYTPSTSQPGALVGNAAVNQQSGPLYVDGVDPRFNLIFDQISSGERHVRGATWNGSALTAETEMPSPLSGSSWQEYSPAVASATRRFYWMSTRDNVVALRTGVIETGEDEVVNIEIPKRVGSGTCPLLVNDATPWVTPDGRRMFLRAEPLDDACQPLEAGATDLFVVPLEASTGMPTQAALPLASVSAVGSTETDPSLSPDLCTLYFASDVGSAGRQDFKLFHAPRR